MFPRLHCRKATLGYPSHGCMQCARLAKVILPRCDDIVAAPAVHRAKPVATVADIETGQSLFTRVTVSLALRPYSCPMSFCKLGTSNERLRSRDYHRLE